MNILSDMLLGYVLKIFDIEGDENLDKMSYRAAFISIITVVILIPLCLLRKVDSLKFTSVLALICIIYLILVIAIQSTQRIIDNFTNILNNANFLSFSTDIFLSFPIISFAFTFHTTLFPVFDELKNQQQIMPAVVSSIAFSWGCYTIVGITGYLSFYESTEGNILLNFDENGWIIAGKVSLAILICFSYPLLFFPLKETVIELVWPSNPPSLLWSIVPCCSKFSLDKQREPLLHSAHSNYSNSSNTQLSSSVSSITTTSSTSVDQIKIAYFSYKNVLVTLVLISIIFTIAILVPDIEVIFGFVGASGGVILVFILPTLFYFKFERKNCSKFMLFCVISVFIIGLVFGLVGIVVLFI
eukprot:TRINITY_DN364_c0_g4_i1.p1 TRINITY_DN364_c0_g4~~TRINITY_DN364_c0_g4_i1.p1  ORF type:complete len:357 (-),score=93.89 TRINITY_DN364_c0_g4_i1:62-1132(-)